MIFKKTAAVFLALTLVLGMFTLSIPAASATDDEDPTGHCEDNNYYMISGKSNYCPDTESFSPQFGESCTLNFVAPEELEVISFQFKLYRNDPDVTLVSYSSFTKQMSYNANAVDNRLLIGSVSSLDPFFIDKGESIFSATVKCSTPILTDVHFEIEDLQVRTESGDKIIIQNGTVIDDGEVVDPTQNPTGYCTDEAKYHLTGASNYCPSTPEFTDFDFGTHTLDFVAPDDLEILNLDFTLYHESTITTLDEYSAFSDDMVFESGKNNVLLTGNFSSLSPVLVMKGESLFKAVVDVETSYDTELHDVVYFDITNLTIKTVDGERVIFKDGKLVDKNPVVFVGDADKNGKVNIDDATLLQRHLAEFTDGSGNRLINEKNTDSLKRADTNRDGIISIMDVTEIQRYVAEIIKSF